MSDTRLFRHQAVVARTDTRFGDAVIHQPLSLRLLVVVLVCVVLVFLIYGGSASINRSERVRGYLSPVDGEVKVYASRPGVIHELNVSDGAVVKSGDVLAIIMDPLTDPPEDPAPPAMVSFLEEQVELLIQRSELLRKRSLLNSELFFSREQTFELEIELLRDDSVLLQRRMLLGEHEYAANRSLYQQGLLSEREHNQSASTRYGLQQAGKNAELNIVTREQVLRDIRASYAIQANVVQEEQVALLLNIVQLRAQQQDLQNQHQYSMRAPRDGQISNLLFTPGDRVDSRVALLSVLSENPLLEAHMYLPSRALAQIRQGQAVQLSYDAFPFATFGSFSAVVTSVALTPMDPRENLFPVDVREPVYLVKAALNTDHGGDVVQLRAGLQFTADIITDSSSLLRRLVSPFLAVVEKL